MMNESTTPALSAQEQAIAEGKKVLHGTATDRVLRMFEAIRTAGPPRVALDVQGMGGKPALNDERQEFRSVPSTIRTS